MICARLPAGSSKKRTRSPAGVANGSLATSVRALDIQTALHNAGSSRDRYFRVPSILGTDDGDQ